MRSIHWLLPAAAILLPLTASAQVNDADYCKALTQKYHAYVSNMSLGHSPIPGAVDGSVAVEQCKAGNTAAGIPVLEKKLRDARIDLPARG